MTIEDAYAVQTALTDRMIRGGRTPVGWKIGLTSRAMQRALGIEFPDSGMLFEDMLMESGAQIPVGRFIRPRVEAEIAFRMKAPISGEASREEILDATEFVAPALEILDTRILRSDPATGKPRQIVDTVADNAANAGVVLGAERHPPDRVDLRWVGAILRRDGSVEETGLGASVLDDPVVAVRWLAERLARLGIAVQAGDLLLSGSFVRPVEAAPGARIHADFGRFGTVSVGFDASG